MPGIEPGAFHMQSERAATALHPPTLWQCRPQGTLVLSEGCSLKHNTILTDISPVKQSGAVEACWAHNPEVDRSKLSSAKSFWVKFF